MSTVTALPDRMPGVRRLLLGVTGSVATIKVGDIVQELRKRNIAVVVVTTVAGDHFLGRSDTSVPADVPVYRDSDEWKQWQGRGDPVLHIELRKWADVFVIAPLDANTLAKLSNGLCDNLLTCVARAWDASRPLLFAPAMNTFMYEHPLTQLQIDKLLSFGDKYIHIPAVAKSLMCGDQGIGAMAEVLTIVTAVERALSG